MSNNDQKPVFTWDEDETTENGGADFLSDVDAQDVPKACSIDNPECEACQ